MCGILYYQGSKDVSQNELNNAVNLLKLRGPDNSIVQKISENKHMGFARLSINDVSSNGNQPLIKDDRYYLICNGEIYNHKELQQENEFFMKSASDCEIIIHMYEKYGIEKTIQSLDGVLLLYYMIKKKIKQ